MQLNLPIIIGIALADSANPVALGVLIELLKSPHYGRYQQSILLGTAYTSGYFVVSFITGLLLIPLFYLTYHSLPLFVHLLGVITLTFGALELNYHFGNQLQPRFTLQLLNHHLRTTNLSQKLPHSPTSSFFYGMAIAFHELPLSRFLYLSVIAVTTITLPAGGIINMLALYNTIVITPLVLITLHTHKGLSIKRFKLWQKEYHHQLHLGVSLLQIILGLWLVTY